LKRFAIITACLTITCATALSQLAPISPDKPNAFTFSPVEARFVRLMIYSADGQPCIDELEVYDAGGKANLALASAGGKATASSCIAGFAIHQVAHLNDGLYGNSHSWIAASDTDEWAQIELPRAAMVAKVVFSRDREGKYKDRLPAELEIQVSMDGKTWRSVYARSKPGMPPRSAGEEDLLRYAFSLEASAWSKIQVQPLGQALKQFDEMIQRFAAAGTDVAKERAELAELRQREKALSAKDSDQAAGLALLFDARMAKRRLFFRDSDLSAIGKVLFVKRHQYRPSHNYSDLLDPSGPPGGAVCVLEIPFTDGRWQPGQAKLTNLFTTKDGVPRDPAASFDARKVYFGYRTSKNDYFHVMSVNADGSGPSGAGLKQLTDGPFHDFYPCPLPDGGIAVISTRCKARFLCWRPQAYVLFRMNADGGDMQPLSYSNLSEWAPSVMADGRIIWTRSEYLDKGADFGHTLWSIRPDGTHPELVFGNDTRYCYANGREVPGTREICCTLIAHGGDLNGPIAFIDTGKGPYDASAVVNITPDVAPHFHMDWAVHMCFRDPVPISRDKVLVSHAPWNHFCLYVIDRYGNRELLYMDPAIDSMCPTPLRPVNPPPKFPGAEVRAPDGTAGQLLISDVYQGLSPAVARGQVKYIRVCQELRADLIRLPGGGYQADHPDFQDWYASPTHKVQGPNGWPSYVAKADLGTVPVESDGSANFVAPSGKVLYFQALDENFNELQRMRSVMQLQPGEKRGCVGCHEPRSSAPPPSSASPGVCMAFRRPASELQPPPWGAGPVSYEKVVQPVWDAKCVRCHDASGKQIDLTGRLDGDKIPASYRTLISRGLVHYFDCTWGQEHVQAAPMTFGTLKSPLWKTLDAGHHDVKLSSQEMRRVKCWIDMNCPLWPDYVHLPDRPSQPEVAKAAR
jgi:hypothetical protein